MPDTPQRIACDTSQKIPIRFGETIKSYIADPSRNVSDLNAIPLVLAGWLRYAKGIDDNGAEFECSPDPMLAGIQDSLKGLEFGSTLDAEEVRKVLLPILKNETIFATDLEKAGLSDKVIAYFIKLMSGKGAVRSTLHEALN